MKRGRILYLLGFMGSGKSEVGRVLAETVAWEFADTDRIVERDEGRSIRQIFEREGEAYFRQAESRALRGLAGRERLIVATGGGLFTIAENRRIIRQTGCSMWLDVTLDAARRRVGEGKDRPLWAPRGELEFRAFFERRRAVYALAALRAEGSGTDPRQVVARIIERFSPVFR